jgi:hypothetical protein
MAWCCHHLAIVTGKGVLINISAQFIARSIGLKSFSIHKSQTDFNDSDIRTIPIVDTSKPDTEAIQALQTHTAELGRGASVSLIDMFKMSMDEVRKIGGNQ